VLPSPEMSAPLRVALIGSGTMGSLHARVLSQNLSTELSVIVDLDEARGRATAAQWGSTWAPELDDLDEVDAVVVATPTHAHIDWARRSLEAGRPTLVEKPVSEALAETESLVADAERLDVPLMCGLLERFNPAVMKMHEIVDEPIHLNVARHSPHTPRIATGVAFDLAVHDVDLAIRLADQMPERVSAHLSCCHPESPEGSEDIAEITLSFPDGMLAGISSSRVSQRKLRSLQVAERTRLIEVDLLRRDITVYHHVTADYLEGRSTGYRQQTVIDIPAILDAREPLAAQLDHFVDLAFGKADHDAERRTILPPHRVLDQVVRAARGSA
jgi:predicted dehydrogenase